MMEHVSLNARLNTIMIMKFVLDVLDYAKLVQESTTVRLALLAMPFLASAIVLVHLALLVIQPPKHVKVAHLLAYNVL